MATLFLSGRIAPRLLDDVQFHAAVLLTAFLGVVRRDRAGLAVAGIGQADRVAKYRTQMEEQLKRYPSTLDKLPESFRKAGKEVLGENA